MRKSKTVSFGVRQVWVRKLVAIESDYVIFLFDKLLQWEIHRPRSNPENVTVFRHRRMWKGTHQHLRRARIRCSGIPPFVVCCLFVLLARCLQRNYCGVEIELRQPFGVGRAECFRRKQVFFINISFFSFVSTPTGKSNYQFSMARVQWMVAQHRYHYHNLFQ